MDKPGVSENVFLVLLRLRVQTHAQTGINTKLPACPDCHSRKAETYDFFSSCQSGVAVKKHRLGTEGASITPCPKKWCFCLLNCTNNNDYAPRRIWLHRSACVFARCWFFVRTWANKHKPSRPAKHIPCRIRTTALTAPSSSNMNLSSAAPTLVQPPRYESSSCSYIFSSTRHRGRRHRLRPPPHLPEVLRAQSASVQHTFVWARFLLRLFVRVWRLLWQAQPKREAKHTRRA
uniref:Uncharacterized protein n=1 Tax=Marophrys sp. SRT127 TaxID=2488311 RepID=A0A455RFS8_9EUKA|nr:hypothetical protein [Marophrys sp. SRT127]